MAVSWGADTYGDSRPPDEGEIFLLLGDLTTAGRLCDHQWNDQHFVSTWIVTYTVEGTPPVTVGRDELLEWFHKVCTPDYSIPSFGSKHYSVKMEDDRTVVRYRLEGGSFAQAIGVRHFLRLKPKEIRSIEYTDVVIRDDDGQIKFLETQVNVERVP